MAAVLVDREGEIATVTINRPEKRNALNAAGWDALSEAFETLSQEDDLRCIVLRGAGPDAFAAGADMSGFMDEHSNAELARSYMGKTHRACEAIARGRHPVVAMIHGFCLGGGFEVATACDIRIAARSSRMGVPARLVGLYLGYGLLDTMIAAVGRANALEIALEGRVYTAGEAFAKGMINRVADDDALEEEAYASARRIAEGAPLAARWHRKAVHRLADPAPLTEEEIAESFSYADTEDYHEGYRAFLAKEKPAFKGR